MAQTSYIIDPSGNLLEVTERQREELSEKQIKDLFKQAKKSKRKSSRK